MYIYVCMYMCNRRDRTLGGYSKREIDNSESVALNVAGSSSVTLK